MKKYINCIITRNNGSIFSNALRLSEAKLIVKMAQENSRVSVEIVEVSKKDYNIIFGLS